MVVLSLFVLYSFSFSFNIKDQLILKCPFGVFKSQKQQQNICEDSAFFPTNFEHLTIKYKFSSLYSFLGTPFYFNSF